MSLICLSVDIEELDVDVGYEYTSGFGPYYDRTLGGWLSGDPPEVKITNATVNIFKDGKTVEFDILPLLSKTNIDSMIESIIEQHQDPESEWEPEL